MDLGRATAMPSGTVRPDQNVLAYKGTFQYPADCIPDHTDFAENLPRVGVIAAKAIVCTLWQSQDDIDKLENDMCIQDDTDLAGFTDCPMFSNMSPFFSQSTSDILKETDREGVLLLPDMRKNPMLEKIASQLKFAGVSFEMSNDYGGGIAVKTSGRVIINTSKHTLRMRGVQRGTLLALDVNHLSGTIRLDAVGMNDLPQHFQVALRPATKLDIVSGLCVGRLIDYAAGEQNAIEVDLDFYPSYYMGISRLPQVLEDSGLEIQLARMQEEAARARRMAERITGADALDELNVSRETEQSLRDELEQRKAHADKVLSDLKKASTDLTRLQNINVGQRGDIQALKTELREAQGLQKKADIVIAMLARERNEIKDEVDKVNADLVNQRTANEKIMESLLREAAKAKGFEDQLNTEIETVLSTSQRLIDGEFDEYMNMSERDLKDAYDVAYSRRDLKNVLILGYIIMHRTMIDKNTMTIAPRITSTSTPIPGNNDTTMSRRTADTTIGTSGSWLTDPFSAMDDVALNLSLTQETRNIALRGDRPGYYNDEGFLANVKAYFSQTEIDNFYSIEPKKSADTLKMYKLAKRVVDMIGNSDTRKLISPVDMLKRWTLGDTGVEGTLLLRIPDTPENQKELDAIHKEFEEFMRAKSKDEDTATFGNSVDANKMRFEIFAYYLLARRDAKLFREIVARGETGRIDVSDLNASVTSDERLNDARADYFSKFSDTETAWKEYMKVVEKIYKKENIQTTKNPAMRLMYLKMYIFKLTEYITSMKIADERLNLPPVVAREYKQEINRYVTDFMTEYRDKLLVEEDNSRIVDQFNSNIKKLVEGETIELNITSGDNVGINVYKISDPVISRTKEYIKGSVPMMQDMNEQRREDEDDMKLDSNITVIEVGPTNPEPESEAPDQQQKKKRRRKMKKIQEVPEPQDFEMVPNDSVAD